MNTLCFLLVLSYISACIQGCDILGPVGVEVGGTAVFQYSSVSVSGTTIYEVRRGDDDAKVIATYSSGSPSTLLTDTNITFTGNHTTGDIGFSFAHVQRSDNGTYILQTSGGQQLQCLTLYVFGVVNATLSVDKNRINEGGKVDFTCSAATMTVPDGIPMSYSWTLDGTAITGSGDMTYTISKATESDKGKYACTVTEDVAGGRTFVSNEIVLEVIEKPLPELCEIFLCWILVVVAAVLFILLVVLHICFIECPVPELAVTDLNFSLFGLRVLLPGCFICVSTLIIHIVVYFVKLANDCDTVECLVVPLIVMVLVAVVGLAIIAVYVNFRAGNKGTKLQKNNTAGKQIGSSDDTNSKL